jgi:L-lactate dehydrogenase (cytochrome)
MIGRAFLYGLAAGGKTGVQQVLQIIQRELDLTMAFCGRRHLGEVDGDILLPKSG